MTHRTQVAVTGGSRPVRARREAARDISALPV